MLRKVELLQVRAPLRPTYQVGPGPVEKVKSIPGVGRVAVATLREATKSMVALYPRERKPYFNGTVVILMIWKKDLCPTGATRMNNLLPSRTNSCWMAGFATRN